MLTLGLTRRSSGPGCTWPLNNPASALISIPGYSYPFALISKFYPNADKP
jgi:hypothetical protein